MLTTAQKDISLERMAMALVGATAGVALWLFVDVLPDLVDNARVLMFLTAFVMSYFAVMMALSGPARMATAALSAIALALPAAAFLLWASLRYNDTADFLQSGHMIAAFLGLLGVSTPFIAAALREKSGWMRYELLFDISWIIVVRYAASWLFVAVFWGVLMLSNALLEMVGITLIEDLLEIKWMPYILTGTVLGLALSVVHELSDYVSPFLILRLLRLLLPIVLLVVSVFIIALPFRGLNGLFGNLSSAATLMAMAWGGITLVTTALDKSDEDAVANTPMQWVTRALAVLLPILAGLAVYAVWLRVVQYGLTPDRIAAGLIAIFITGYALAYLVAILRRHNWMADIRLANRNMAMALIAACALWFTPLFNAERLSTNNQIARFEAGQVDVAGLAVWEMSNEWGHAGTAGIERLRAMEDHADYTALTARINKAASASSKYAFYRDLSRTTTNINAADLHALIPVVPAGATLPQEIFEDIGFLRSEQLLAGCKRELPDGRKGCVALVATFNPAQDQPQGVVLYLNAANLITSVRFGATPDNRSLGGQLIDLTTGERTDLPLAVLEQALDGNFTLEPANLRALHIGGLVLIPDN